MHLSSPRLLAMMLPLLYCFVQHITAASSESCGNSNQFHISINMEPKYYVPKATYIVGIESNDVHPFTSFSLTTEPEEKTLLTTGKMMGWFHLMSDDTEAEFSPDEMNVIVAQNDSPKQSIHVLWAAPNSNQDCLIFRAEVSYEIDSEICTQRLKRKFCPLDERFDSNPDEECCACDEAKYTMAFEGLWSNATHPKFFPPTLQLTHFSDILVVTHSRNLTMWAEGEYASEGLRQLAEYGSASILESELKEKKKHLLSIIKVAGLWYPKMNSNTTSNFAVDRMHNLLSLGTMLGPSPDWFTGVSKLNLCTKNCSWVENKVVDLALYDAGTDSGVLYMSPDAPTIPQERVYRITGSYPEDPRAPFYNINDDKVKPIARLYLKRDQVIKGSCSEESEFDLDENKFNDENENNKRPECGTTNFTDWSSCSVSCGKGFRFRTRNYLNPAKAKISNCAKRNIQKKICVADTRCPGEPDYNYVPVDDENNCNTTSWSEWSECTATCGIGFMTRSRRFLKHSGYKKCRHVDILEKKKCMEPPCKTTVVEKEMSNCTTTEWSDWSPCTVTCGTGFRIRVRYLTVSRELFAICQNSVKLEERRECIRTKECVIDKEKAKEICQMPAETGMCRAYFERWYFNPETNRCDQFIYGGCRGNRNNFLTLDECIKTCSSL